VQEEDFRMLDETYNEYVMALTIARGYPEPRLASSLDSKLDLQSSLTDAIVTAELSMSPGRGQLFRFHDRSMVSKRVHKWTRLEHCKGRAAARPSSAK
jgi:hypothetical protein